MKEIFISQSEWTPEEQAYFDDNQFMEKVRKHTAELNEFSVYIVEANDIEKQCKVIIDKSSRIIDL